MPLPPTRCHCGQRQPCPTHPQGWKSSKSPKLPSNWGKLVRDVKRDSLTVCYLCGNIDTSGSVDHKIPRAEGGGHGRDNLAWICQRCHKLKTQQESKRGNKRRRK